MSCTLFVKTLLIQETHWNGYSNLLTFPFGHDSIYRCFLTSVSMFISNWGLRNGSIFYYNFASKIQNVRSLLEFWWCRTLLLKNLDYASEEWDMRTSLLKKRLGSWQLMISITIKKINDSIIMPFLTYSSAREYFFTFTTAYGRIYYMDFSLIQIVMFISSFL